MKIVNNMSALGFGGHGPVRNRRQEKFNARRTQHAGYPKTDKFASLEEIDRYFAGDKIECLLCGRVLRSIGGSHLKMHGVTVEQYKERFGIPWRRGLVSAESHAAYGAAVKTRLKDPETKRRFLAQAVEARKLIKNSKHRPNVLAVVADITARCFKNAGIDKTYTSHDAERFLGRLKAGITPKEIAKETGMPSMSWWHSYRNNNKNYDQRVRETIEAWPFSLQARITSLGARFKFELRVLFDKGLSDKQAAKFLGVTAMTCNRITKTWRQEKRNV